MVLCRYIAHVLYTRTMSFIVYNIHRHIELNCVILFSWKIHIYCNMESAITFLNELIKWREREKIRKSDVKWKYIMHTTTNSQIHIRAHGGVQSKLAARGEFSECGLNGNALIWPQIGDNRPISIYEGNHQFRVKGDSINRKNGFSRFKLGCLLIQTSSDPSFGCCIT